MANTRRAKSAEALGLIGDQSVVPVLKEMTKDENGNIVDASVAALAKLGDKTNVDAFIAGLDSSDPLVRKKACEVLAYVKETRAISKIKGLATHFDKTVKDAANMALAKMGDLESGPVIATLLLEKEPSLRETACKALGILETQNTFPS